jgi:hypothetical protein
LEWLTTQLATVISFIRSVEDKGKQLLLIASD